MRIIVLFLAIIFALPAMASDPELNGEYQKWQVYHYQEANGPVCYAMTRAEKTTDAKGKVLKIKDRGRVLLQVTRRVAEGNGLVVSFVAGHSIKSKTDVLATVGKAHFHLRGDGDTAWTNNPSDDATIVQSIRKAKTITIAHQGRKATLVIDDFSIKGASAALDALSNCE
jgi:hypothetical protein